MSIAKVYGSSLGLAVTVTSELHKSIIVSIYKEIDKLDSLYGVDCVSVQGIGTPANHQTVIILRVLQFEHDTQDGEVRVVGIGVIADNQFTAITDPGYDDVSGALSTGASTARGDGRESVMIYKSGDSPAVPPDNAGKAIDDLIRNIFGDPEKGKES